VKRHETRIDAVMESIRSRIASRAYSPGTRLPSVRAQAKAMGLSVSTVVEAYERLAAEQVICARPGSGFYVSGPVAPVDPFARSDRASIEKSIHFGFRANRWKPARHCSNPAVAGFLPRGCMRRECAGHYGRPARADATVLADYATPLGPPALRQLLARRMAAADIAVPPEQIMLAESGTQAIDLICRFLLEPGDAVLVDDPCYFNFHALLRAHRVKAVGVPFTPNGPNTVAFEAALREHSPRLYITNSGIHNPTGATLSSVTAHRLLKLADDANLVIVEDDIFADFEITPAPRLAAFDGLARVIHIGSFSKTLSASLRCGYIAARADWIDSLADLKIATSFGGGQLAAAVLLTALTDSGYRKHMEGVRLRLAEARDKTIARLDAIGITPLIVPQAGMFLWCQLPGGIDAADIARFCLKEGMVLAPGNAFSQSLSASGFLRFNVAQSTDRRVFDILARALPG